MEPPSFDLCFSQESLLQGKPDVEQLKRTITSRPKLQTSRGRGRGRACATGRGRGRGRGKTISKSGCEIVEISSQEPEEGVRGTKKSGPARRGSRRYPVRQRVQPNRKIKDHKVPFVGQPFIYEEVKIDEPFSSWIKALTASFDDEHFVFEEVPFKLNDPGWVYYTDSIFIDSTFACPTEKVPLPDKSWVYQHRDFVSIEISNVLDAWVKKYFQDEIFEEDYPFHNKSKDLFLDIHQFRDLLYEGNTVGSEV